LYQFLSYITLQWISRIENFIVFQTNFVSKFKSRNFGGFSSISILCQRSGHFIDTKRQNIKTCHKQLEFLDTVYGRGGLDLRVAISDPYGIWIHIDMRWWIRIQYFREMLDPIPDSYIMIRDPQPCSVNSWND
jgi:hypothetical protein